MVGKAQLHLDKLAHQKPQSKKTDKASENEFKDALKKSSKKEERKEEAVAVSSPDQQVQNRQSISADQKSQAKDEQVTQIPVKNNDVSNSVEMNQAGKSLTLMPLNFLQQSQNVEEQMAQSIVETSQPQNIELLTKQATVGNLDLANFIAVEPEALNLNSELLNVTNKSESVDTALSSFGNELSKLNEFLQNNSAESGAEDQLTQEQPLSDLLTASHTKMKENANFNQLLSDKVSTSQMSDSVQQTNVDNIIQHARSVIKDGGGEMQIKLTPDGLGTVDLKVDVKNGQVNVEILADNKATKHMFESGLSDIKGALEAQNLKVDMVKVDISGDMQKHFSENQLDMMNREFARGFLGQFRDDRSFFRNQILSDSLERMPTDGNGPEGISPAYQRLNSNNVKGQRRLSIFA